MGRYKTGYCRKHNRLFKKYGYVPSETIFDKNDVIIKDGVSYIILKDKYCKETARAIIDNEDVDAIKNYKWCLSDTGYAISRNRKKITRKNGSRYRAVIYNKKSIYLGYFDTPEEAAIAYNHAAIKHFDKFAWLNKVPILEIT